jgi:hypothetical protein
MNVMDFLIGKQNWHQTLVTETEMAPETWGIFRQLTRLVFREDFINRIDLCCSVSSLEKVSTDSDKVLYWRSLRTLVEGRISPPVRLFVASCQHLYCWTDFCNVHETFSLIVVGWFRFSSAILARNKVHFTSVCYDVFTYICYELLINF